MTLVCDHVGFVVEEIEAALPQLTERGITIGAIEEFPNEGTRELYLGDDGQAARILLLQPLGPSGPYRRALEKRGPGLHHIAFRLADAAGFFGAHPGWLLQPKSLETWPATRTLWAARPGLGTLIEIQEGAASYAGAPLVEALSIAAGDRRCASMVSALSGGTTLVPSEEASMTIAGAAMPIGRWLGLDGTGKAR